MNYNQNAGVRNRKWQTTLGPGRKVQRVSDVNAMGPSAPTSASPYLNPMLSSGSGVNIGFDAYNSNIATSTAHNIEGFNNSGYNMPTSSYNFAQHSTAAPPLQPQQPPAYSAANNSMPQMPFSSAGPTSTTAAGQQFPMFQQPIVQDMAMMYGQQLADHGKQLVENQFGKYVPVAKLKYYFAVDNNYVINKLRLLFFPFTHKDWSLKYDQENPVQPRYDINAPDLYIPAMAYITYVVVAGLMLGMQNRFSPEQLGIQASSALAYCLFELIVYSITLYVVNIKTNLKALDLLAFSGYKFVIIVGCLLVSSLFYGFGYYCALIYSSLTLGFFLLRTLKTKVLHDPAPASTSGAINYDPYGNPQQLDYTGGRKRKLYFLFLIVGGQAFLSFLLSKHLYLRDISITLDARESQFP